MSNNKYKVVSNWNKRGSRWVNQGDNKWSRESNNDKLAMVIMTVDGKSVTRHVRVD